MKLIVAGATGFVGTEVIRQALSIPAITSVVALARRQTAVPENVASGADTSKLKPVVLEDFGTYTDAVKQELSGADACIWTMAITPTKSKTLPFEEVKKACLDHTVVGLETIFSLRNKDAGKPFRFIYTSGAMVQRDPAKKPLMMGDYLLMRGEAETKVLALAEDNKGAAETCVTRPGMIDGPGRKNIVMKAVQDAAARLSVVSVVQVSEVAAAMLDQTINGIEKDTLLNDDLVRIGQKALADQTKV